MASRDGTPESMSPLSDAPSTPDEYMQNFRAMKAGARSVSPDALAPEALEGPPKKRQRTTKEAREELLHPVQTIPEDLGNISEDTEGSVPGSPTHPAGGIGAQDEEALAGEQITACKWEGCDAGDVGNMDNLVDHLSDAHIQARQKKYSCEWIDCSRKGIPHASGYALRAHMRSHTREKPFYCSLPECDRSFTRSDALAKHMRTVHETEALRPSDPVPKHHSSNPSNKFQRLRLTIKSSNGGGTTGPGSDKSAPASPSTISHPVYTQPTDTSYENMNVTYLSNDDDDDTARIKQFPPDIYWTDEEASMHPQDLLRLLQRQLVWANEDSDALKRELHELESKRKEEWIAKELLLENAMEAEVALTDEKEARRAPRHDIDPLVLQRIEQDAEGTRELELEPGTRGTPWWRTGGKWASKGAGGAQQPPLATNGDVEMGGTEEAAPAPAIPAQS